MKIYNLATITALHHLQGGTRVFFMQRFYSYGRSTLLVRVHAVVMRFVMDILQLPHSKLVLILLLVETTL